MKSPLKSKTLWFNVIAVGVAVLGPVLGAFGFTGEVPGEAGIYVSLAVPVIIALVNAVLRYRFTDTSLRGSGPTGGTIVG
jgi:uncharacterized membrane protein